MADAAIIVGILLGSACLLGGASYLRERREAAAARADVARRLTERHSYEEAGTTRKLKGISNALRKSLLSIKIDKPRGDVESAEAAGYRKDISDDVTKSKPLTGGIPAMPQTIHMITRDNSAASSTTTFAERVRIGRSHTDVTDKEEAPIKVPADVVVFEVCAICQSGFEHGEDVLLLPCEHAFHTPCIEEYFARVEHPARCPVCQQNLEEMCGHHKVTSSTETNATPENGRARLLMAVKAAARRISVGFRGEMQTETSAAAHRTTTSGNTPVGTQTSDYRRWRSL